MPPRTGKNLSPPERFGRYTRHDSGGGTEAPVFGENTPMIDPRKNTWLRQDANNIQSVCAIPAEGEDFDCLDAPTGRVAAPVPLRVLAGGFRAPLRREEGAGGECVERGRCLRNEADRFGVWTAPDPSALVASERLQRMCPREGSSRYLCLISKSCIMHTSSAVHSIVWALRFLPGACDSSQRECPIYRGDWSNVLTPSPDRRCPWQ